MIIFFLIFNKIERVVIFVCNDFYWIYVIGFLKKKKKL